MRFQKKYGIVLVASMLLLSACARAQGATATQAEQTVAEPTAIETTEQPESSIPTNSEAEPSASTDIRFSLGGNGEKKEFTVQPFASIPYAEINDNKPLFSDADKMVTDPFEWYSDLDSLGRCGEAYANICTELMPTEERGKIGHVKPSGWHTANYNGYVDGNYLYNRCHLIGFQLAGENDNEQNLITGTRYMNVTGMLPFEDQVADYVKGTGNHVLYRVTPIFTKDNLVADGVVMEAYSVEDKGKGVQFCVFVYNVQPDIVIDYASGDSHLKGTETVESESKYSSNNELSYIVNINTKKFHNGSCSAAADIKPENAEVFNGDRQWLLDNGYVPCQ